MHLQQEQIGEEGQHYSHVATTHLLDRAGDAVSRSLFNLHDNKIVFITQPNEHYA